MVTSPGEDWSDAEYNGLHPVDVLRALADAPPAGALPWTLPWAARYLWFLPPSAAASPYFRHPPLPLPSPSAVNSPYLRKLKSLSAHPFSVRNSLLGRRDSAARYATDYDQHLPRLKGFACM